MAVNQHIWPWLQQPQEAVSAAREGEFGTGLKSALLMSQRALDAARQYLPSADSGVTFVPTQHGIAARGSTGGADGIALTGGSGFSSIVPGDKNFTVMMLCRVNSLGARKFLLGDYNSGGTGESIWIEQTAGNQWAAGIVSTQPLQKVISGGAVTTGWHWVELFESGTTLELRVDDVLINTTSTTGLRRAGSDIRLMRPGAFAGLSFDGDIAACLMHEGALPASTRAAIRSNPNLAFAPQTIEVPVSAGGGPATVGAATEADAALGLSAVQIAAAGRADETDASIALAAVQARATGRADESDSALALNAVQIGAVGQAAETDAALALDPGATGAVGVALETDVAMALAAVQITATGIATEVDTALALTGLAGTAPGIASETDTAFALAAVQKLVAGAALEVDTALALSTPGGTLDLILKILANRQELNPATGTFTLYDDDGTTVLYTTNAWADAAGTVPYSGGALRRIDALF